MNILDESTKAMLDAGSTAVLNGGYLVMTPETFKHVVQTASITAVDMFSDVISEQPAIEETNDNSIQQGCRCHFCGKESDCGTEYIMTIEGGYNSVRDTETVSMEVCGGCLEKMLAVVS